MKKLLMIICGLSIVACQQDPKIDYTVITGKVENTKATTVEINNADYTKEITIDASGTFTDTLDIPESGFYTLSIGREYTPLYLKKGNELAMSLDANQFDESIKYTGEGAIENNYLAAKTLNNIEVMTNAREFYSLEEETFLKELSKIKNNNESQLGQLTEADQDFLATEKQNLVYDNYAMLNTYAERHGSYTNKQDFKVSEGFIPSELKNMAFDDEKAYKSSSSYKNMAFTDLMNSIFENIGDDITEVDVSDLKQLKEVKIQALKNDAIDYLGSFLISPANPNMEAIYTFFKENSTDEDDIKSLTETFDKNKDLIKGKPSPQFVNYENHEGGTTSLSDLKGKYVYVDVWATWCGPCIREIPSLKEVEKNFHNENIAFVSASIDEKKNHDKWVTMVDDKELGGIQLMADNDWNSQFVKDYAIQGIPRFILIDPNGNIVSADAPRPSNPKLTELLKNELNSDKTAKM
ncbi:MAG: AhpC/TSA family protein [Algicola sp.]|nr:AhpC/TSA family protein [Algicola sp.]